MAADPEPGIARHVIDGFRSVPTRTGKVRYFLPAEAHMQAVGEEIEPGADETIQTEFDYPMRNVYQISKSIGLIAITGGDGTLEEILPALADYDLPVSAYQGSGQAAVALGALVEVFPEWASKVLITDEQMTSCILWLSRDRPAGDDSEAAGGFAGRLVVNE